MYSEALERKRNAELESCAGLGSGWLVSVEWHENCVGAVQRSSYVGHVTEKTARAEAVNVVYGHAGDHHDEAALVAELKRDGAVDLGDVTIRLEAVEFPAKKN